ncbi:unnamed protein product [Lactuca saligna]|uniref:DELLA protein n=1 Tax=Lactuca saligna TaxID=75948 RepID=A0AA35ZC95_LACSI|nr:unnamed protein product [Lactuca saligna]
MFTSEKFALRKVVDDNLSVAPSETRSNLIKDHQKPFHSNFENLGKLYFDFTSPGVQNTSKATDFQLKEDEKGSAFSSLGIVKDYASRPRKMNADTMNVPSSNNEDPETNDQKLSTTARIRMASQEFIDSYSSKDDETSQLSHPFAVSFSGLSDDEAKDIQLLLTLLASAEKTGQKQFKCALKLIELCSNMSLNEGNPVERLVYYFSEAIHMKINREMGRLACNERESMQIFDLREALMNVDTCISEFHLKVPLSQVCQFSSIHTIFENLNKATKIHVIDLESCRAGIQYLVLMQAIASCSEWHIDHIKITAVATSSDPKIKDTCKRLADFAKSMNIPFSFKIIMIGDVLDFNVDMIERNEGEKVAVYAPFFLSTLIAKPKSLEYLMRVIRKIKPCITVITEVEANHTSSAFVDRFTEALFFYGALFDSMSDCLADDDLNRKVMESVCYGKAIRNIVAADGDERTIRHICVDVWRKFFQRFGMLEIELTDETLNETNLVIGNFKCGNSCSVLVDGGCFLVEWKGVPIFSVSAWKFI